MPYLTGPDGTRLFYLDAGQGPPIVFVHGYGSSHECWSYQVQALSGRYRCVALDLRGHGNSDKPFSRYTYDENCRDLRTLIEQLELTDVTLVGWSMGAGIVLTYLLDDGTGVTKAVFAAASAPRMTATATEPYGMTPAEGEEIAEMIRTQAPETLAGLCRASFHRDLPATRDWFTGIALRMPVYAQVRSYRHLLDLDLRGRLPEVGVPTLVLHGRHDQVCDPRWGRYLAEHLPSSKIVFFEDSGHALMVEEPDRFSAELAAFVEASGAQA